MYKGGSPYLCRLCEPDSFYERYARQSGIEVSMASVRYYQVFSLLKLAATHMAAARCFEEGRFNDMRMPAMSGLEALQALSRADQLPPTIILTTFDDDQMVLAGMKAGARGYLLKDVSLEQLVEAVKTVASGGSLVQPVVTQRLLTGLKHMTNDFASLDRPDPLTERETEILRLMAGGYSNKEIANSLGVAEGTRTLASLIDPALGFVHVDFHAGAEDDSPRDQTAAQLCGEAMTPVLRELAAHLPGGRSAT